jgi:hypothetical protein
MRVIETKGVFPRPSGGAKRSAVSLMDETVAKSRALVAVAQTTTEGRDPTSNYRPAAFLAHLIAMKDQHPQTRERRRVEPQHATAAYSTTAALVGQ